MKLLFTQARTARAGGADDNLGRGMETALLLAFFLGIGRNFHARKTIRIVAVNATRCEYLFTCTSACLY